MYDNDALLRLAKGAKSAGSDAIGSTSALDPSLSSSPYSLTLANGPPQMFLLLMKFLGIFLSLLNMARFLNVVTSSIRILVIFIMRGIFSET